MAISSNIFLYETFCYGIPGRRDFGMLLMNTRWKDRPSFLRYTLYNILYTLSFASLFIYFYIPFDLFVLNMFAFQLPAVCLTGTTLHGYLAGMETR